MFLNDKYARIPDVRKIAVVRANAIGDLVFTLPAFEALRATYPGAEIVLLGQEWHARFLNGRPGPIDRAVAIPPCRGVSTPDDVDTSEYAGDLERFLAAMQAEHFDIALQMHGGGRYSNPFTRRLGARVTAGLKAADAEPLDRYLPYVYFQPEVPRYLEAVSLVGARSITLEPRLALTEGDLDESYSVVPERGRKLAVLHVGSGDPRRRWSPRKFAEVGDALSSEGFTVLVNAARDEERALSDAVIAGMRAPAGGVGGRLSLGGFAGLLSRAAVVVSNDSGPMHIATAVGTPTVGIYWVGNAMTAAPVTRTHHRPCISWRLNCPVCGTNTLTDSCTHQVSFVDDVSVEEVLGEAHELLAHHRPEDRPEPYPYAQSSAVPALY